MVDVFLNHFLSFLDGEFSRRIQGTREMAFTLG